MAKGQFSKIALYRRASSTEAAYSENAIAIHYIAMACYVTAVPAFVCSKLPAQEAIEQFLWFMKTDILRFDAFSPFFPSIFLYL